ncbi:hypothetical protein D9757_011194 [Collybiopsis confluens]|uniref:F-box domain-containing protein n=1 Tax=Collybiopsis confluens TaxID=2823264 RepID=A0A8H5H3B2_9AGAR|nr:hypothetical protein D9757_011194 [Collybiopsis confluens]
MYEYLPIELEEAIISHLSNSKPDLQNCSLVCKSWLPSTRALLFHSLSETGKPSSGTAGPFLSAVYAIQKASHLKHLPQRLKVDCAHILEYTRLVFNTVHLGNMTHLWLCRADFSRFDLNISLTLSLLSSLRGLAIDRTVFLNACQLLHFLSSPCFRNLRFLSLTDVSYLQRPEPGNMRSAIEKAEGTMDYWKSTTVSSPTSMPPSRIELEELEIGLIPEHNVFHLLYHPDSSFDWKRLKRIKFYRVWDNTLIQGFLNGPLPVLKSIAFDRSDMMYHFTSSGPFTGVLENPSVVTNLTEISMNIISFAHDPLEFGMDFFGLSWVTEHFSDQAPQIDVHIHLPTDLGFVSSSDRNTKQTKASVDMILGLTLLPSIRSVHLVVPLSAGSSMQDRKSVKDICEDWFAPSTRTRIRVEYREVPAGDEREPFTADL